jgi:hypothetical protein
MWWNSGAWLWWWLAFLLIFFVLPVTYGWGYRGWGPWYRRRRFDRRNADNAGRTYLRERRTRVRSDYPSDGWGDRAGTMWLVLIVAAT